MGLPEQREGRPHTGPAASKNLNSTTSSISAQLRRRRDAANRCEPGNGFRDPLDSYRTSDTYRPVWITTDSPARVALVKGYGVADVLRAEGFKPIWSAASRGYLIDLHRLPDAVAVLEWSGRQVRCRERGAA